MENQDIGLGSIFPWTVQESCGSPTLSSVKPCSLIDNHMRGFGVNASSQPSRLSSAMNASNHVHAATHLPIPEHIDLIDENFHAQSTDMGDFSAGMKEDTALFKKHDFGTCNRIEEGLKQVQMLDGLELQFSEACNKRFIIFDQAGDRARIIFHPALVYEFSNVLPSSPNVVDNTKDLDNIVGEKETIQKILSACASTDWGARLSDYRGSMALAYPALPKLRKTGLDLATHGEVFCGFSADEETDSHMSCNGSSQGCYSQFHEDSKDIEALLSSDYDDDEEASTGHTPSEGIINNELTFMEDCSDVGNGVPRKRKRCGDLECREQEVDFTPTTVEEKASSILKCTSAKGCLRLSRSHESKIQPDGNINAVGFEHIDDQFCDSASSKSVASKASSKSSATNQGVSCNSTVRQSNSSKKSRIEKMKRTLDLLRGVIPAGDCMDTAVVLDAATRYLKSLQLQVKKLEANQYGKC